MHLINSLQVSLFFLYAGPIIAADEDFVKIAEYADFDAICY